MALEITCPGPESALALVGAARRLGVSAKARVVRDVDRVAIRDGDSIAAMLTRLGAHDSVMAWEERRIRREVRASANRLANFLRAKGTRPGSLVGVCLERSPDLVVALLATLKAGAAYVPLDPEYPAERLAAMLEDAAPSVVITRSDLEPVLAPLPAGVAAICLDTAVAELEAQSPSPPELPASTGDDLAYVIFTSGSTGRATKR